MIISEDKTVGCVAWVGDMRNAYKILVGKPETKRPLKNLGVDRRIILELVLGTYG
jgi:hypothetical protein